MRPLYVLALFAIASSAEAQAAAKHSYMPRNGFVPDSTTAVRIAEAIWAPIYGDSQIIAQRPYHAILRNGRWTVSGSLPPNQPGGVPVAVISKRDGRIIRVSHSK
jgi:hypothetical protein